MYQKSLRTLEFDKICRQLRDHMVLPTNQKRAEELLPFENVEEIQHALNETEQAQSLLLKRGEPPITKVDEINIDIQRLTVSGDRKSTRLNSSHKTESRMPSSA